MHNSRAVLKDCIDYYIYMMRKKNTETIWASKLSRSLVDNSVKWILNLNEWRMRSGSFDETCKFMSKALQRDNNNKLSQRCREMRRGPDAPVWTIFIHVFMSHSARLHCEEAGCSPVWSCIYLSLLRGRKRSLCLVLWDSISSTLISAISMCAAFSVQTLNITRGLSQNLWWDSWRGG